MAHIPKDATDDEVVEIIRRWVEVLAEEDYERIGSALGYGLSFGDAESECILRAIRGYRSPTYFPGEEQFKVTEWRSAEGGNPNPRCLVTRYKPNAAGLAGSIEFDLPLNGRWSDLTADFVWFISDDPQGGYRLGLEEISSLQQAQRDADATQ